MRTGRYCMNPSGAAAVRLIGTRCHQSQGLLKTMALAPAPFLVLALAFVRIVRADLDVFLAFDIADTRR